MICSLFQEEEKDFNCQRQLLQPFNRSELWSFDISRLRPVFELFFRLSNA